MKLTGPVIAKLTLPQGKAEAMFWDDELPGFGLRLRGGGKQTWIVQYRIGTKQRRVSFGTPSSLPADKARRTAGNILAKARLGQDFAAEKERARSEAAQTLGALVKRYLSEHVVKHLRERSAVEVQRHLEKHWKPLHATSLGRIDRRAVSERVSRLVEESGPTAANRARSSLAALFGWAMRHGLADANPVIGSARPGLERSRERVLSLAELAAVWAACPESDDYGRIVRLLILTGQRREEVGAMRWRELDLERALWSLPPERTKNHRHHEVPLSELAVAVLRAVPQRASRDLLFGQGERQFQNWGYAKARLLERLAEGQKGRGAAPFVLHDIRRSVVTHMAEMGIVPHVIEAVVNHVSGHRAGVAGIYNRATYAVEKRQALDRWGQRVTEIVEGAERAKVVPLRA